MRYSKKRTTNIGLSMYSNSIDYFLNNFISPNNIFTTNFKTYMSTTVQGIIGQLHFIEEHRLGRPVRTESWTIRMEVHSLCALWFCSSGRHPLGTGELVATIAAWHHFQEHTIVHVFLETSEGNPQRWKHASVMK